MRWHVLSAILVLASPAAADEIDKAKLRDVVSLPALNLKFGVGFDSRQGVSGLDAERDAQVEIAQLNKAMKGSASDAARHARLAELYDMLHDKEKSQKAAVHAVDLYRQQRKTDPDNGRLLSKLALALLWADDSEKAEKAARHAVELAPREWECHLTLGRVLSDKALFKVTDGASDLDRVIQIVASKKGAGDLLKQVQADLDEAMKLYDRAAELAPGEVDVWGQRVYLRIGMGYIRAGQALLEQKEVDPLSLLLSDDLLADVQKWADVSPNDPRAIATAIVAPWMAAVNKEDASPSPREGESGLDLIPEKSRRAIEKNAKLLDKLTEAKNPVTAASACEVLGIVYMFVYQDIPKSQAKLRRAVELDPDRDQAWDLLSMMLAEDKPKECLEVCGARLKHKDTPHNRLMAAKLYERQGEFDKALDQARLAAKLDAKDVGCKIAVATMLLKHDDAKSVQQAGEQLAAAEKLLKDAKAEDLAKEYANLHNDYLLTSGICHALAGKRAEGEKLIRDLLKADAKNEKAQQALAAMGK
jgi:tetratricopeptide (TPR) repeat protein